MRITQSHTDTIRSIQNSLPGESASLRKKTIERTPINTPLASSLILLEHILIAPLGPQKLTTDLKNPSKNTEGTRRRKNILEPKTRYASTGYDNPRRIR